MTAGGCPMPNRHSNRHTILALAGAGLFAAAMAHAAAPEPAKNKKLYCWEDRGTRVCSDALPPEAVNRARDEFNVRSGLRSGAIERALTEQERAEAAARDAQRKVDEAIAESRRRTDQAMLLSYANEDELKRVFAERTALVDNSVRTARFNVASLREGLVSMLQRAGDRELGGGKANAKLAEGIRQRHAELLHQQQQQAKFEAERVSLDAEVAEILQRYRQMKGLDAAPATGPEAAAPAPGQG